MLAASRGHAFIHIFERLQIGEMNKHEEGLLKRVLDLGRNIDDLR